MFLLNKEQVRYFRDNLQIEFEEVFKEEQVNLAAGSLNELHSKLRSLSVENSLKNRIELKKLLTSAPLDLEPLRKLILNKPIANLAKQLFEVPSLRFAAACLIVPEALDLFKPMPLVCFAKDCNIRPIEGGWILCLKAPNPERAGSAIWSMTPDQIGSIRVFRGDLTLDLSQIAATEGIYLLCLYTSKDGVATKGAIDLWDIWLKDLGYAFGDPLLSVTHPLVAAP